MSDEDSLADNTGPPADTLSESESAAAETARTQSPQELSNEEKQAIIERKTTVEAGDCRCKLGVVMEKYDFAERESRLLQYWVGVRTPDTHWREILDLPADPADVGTVSLRTLERYVNITLLRHAFIDAAENPPLHTVAQLYDLQQADALDGQHGIGTSEDLAAVDVDRVARDFVSYSTISRHFKSCCDVPSTLKTDALTRAEIVDRARSYEDYFQTKLQQVLSTLASTAPETDLQDKDVLTRSEVYCESCGTGVPLYDFIEGQTCECQQ